MIEAFIIFITWSIFGMLNFMHIIEFKQPRDLSLLFFFASGPAVWMFFLIVVFGRLFADWMRQLWQL